MNHVNYGNPLKNWPNIVFVAKDSCAMVSTLSNGVILDTIQVTLEIKIGCTNQRRLALYITVTVTLWLWLWLSHTLCCQQCDSFQCITWLSKSMLLILLHPFLCGLHHQKKTSPHLHSWGDIAGFKCWSPEDNFEACFVGPGILCVEIKFQNV